MTTLADRTIVALRATHDDLAALVPGLTDEQLLRPSGASEWSVAQVLSHLGSGAEIGLATLEGALGASPAAEPGFNENVWDRWNAMSPREQATNFLDHNTRLVAAYEALTAEQRMTAQVDLGFLPEPLPLASLAGMRLNESALHSGTSGSRSTSPPPSRQTSPPCWPSTWRALWASWSASSARPTRSPDRRSSTSRAPATASSSPARSL
jgi:hypothetical protein